MNDTPFAPGGIIPSTGSDHVPACIGTHESIVRLTDLKKFHAGELPVGDLLRQARPYPIEEDPSGSDHS